MAKLPHTCTYRNHKVTIVLKNGQIILDRFKERPKCKRWIVLKNYGRISLNNIKSFTPFRKEDTR